jgi:carbon-monoxide dehydrogenase large subunit
VSPLIGTSVPRREDERILRGRARYLDDIELGRMAHAAVVRSPHAHARIGTITRPDAAPGLIAVVTAEDLAGRVRPFPVPQVDGATIAPEAHPVLAEGLVRYVGQPVALVVAESREQAEDAAELVAVEYEPLDAVVDARRAEERLMHWSRSVGDVDGAFAAAANVFRGHYGLPRLVAAPIETRGAIAEEVSGQLTVWCSAQDPHRPLQQLGHVLSRPEDTIRLVVPDVGGAFGSKGVVAPEVAAVAIAAADLGRPVKWAEDRLENFQAAYQGRGMQADVELALDGEGTILAIRARIWADLGAFHLSTTPIPPHTAAMLMGGCYDVQNIEVELIGARTNKVTTGPYRGAGRPEAAYFLERAVDDAARAAGIDPVALRRRNLIRSFPYKTPLGWTYDSGDYEACLDKALALLGDVPESDDERVVGTGVALYVERAGGMWESADATVEPDGRVVIRSGSSPHGQGHETTFAQIAADTLGVEMGDIVMRFGDSAVVPRGVGTFASRSVAMGGSAIVVALERIVERGTQIAAHMLEAVPEDVTYAEGVFSSDGERRVTLREVARLAYRPLELPKGMEPGLHASGRFRSPMVFSSGANAAAVEV